MEAEREAKKPGVEGKMVLEVEFETKKLRGKDKMPLENRNTRLWKPSFFL